MGAGVGLGRTGCVAEKTGFGVDDFATGGVSGAVVVAEGGRAIDDVVIIYPEGEDIFPAWGNSGPAIGGGGTYGDVAFSALVVADELPPELATVSLGGDEICSGFAVAEEFLSEDTADVSWGANCSPCKSRAALSISCAKSDISFPVSSNAPPFLSRAVAAEVKAVVSEW